ncbi:dUTP diphosphatase [archaeon]|nr:dUTP diphosphatase [archaeon]
MKIKFAKGHEDAITPKYAHEGDAAFDFHSVEDVLLKIGEKKVVKTGIKMAIPENHVGLVWDRSGLAAKNGIHVMAGVIDSIYRGEIMIVLKNLGEEDFQIEKGMRIAQMLIQPVVTANLEEVESLDNTERAEGNFGSTGLN